MNSQTCIKTEISFFHTVSIFSLFCLFVFSFKLSKSDFKDYCIITHSFCILESPFITLLLPINSSNKTNGTNACTQYTHSDTSDSHTKDCSVHKSSISVNSQNNSTNTTFFPFSFYQETQDEIWPNSWQNLQYYLSKKNYACFQKANLCKFKTRFHKIKYTVLLLKYSSPNHNPLHN